MKNNFPEWVKKAENDWKVVKILVASKDPPPDGITFHSQQTAEKYLKAFLVSKNIPPEKTHNLLKLLNDVEQFEPGANVLKDSAGLLNRFSVEPRYPGDFADPPEEEVKEAVESARRIRYFFRKVLRVKKKKKK